MNVIDKRKRLLSDGRIALLLFALALLYMFCINGIDVRNTVPYIQEVSGAKELPDTLPFYDADRLYGMLNSLGAAGREAYRSFLLSYDAAFPPLYSCALALCASFLLRKAFPGSVRAPKLALVPIAAGLFDYLENVSMLLLLDRYPGRADAWATAAGGFTLAKWTMTAASAAVLIAALAVAIARRGKAPASR